MPPIPEIVRYVGMANASHVVPWKTAGVIGHFLTFGRIDSPVRHYNIEVLTSALTRGLNSEFVAMVPGVVFLAAMIRYGHFGPKVSVSPNELEIITRDELVSTTVSSIFYCLTKSTLMVTQRLVDISWREQSYQALTARFGKTSIRNLVR